MRESKELEITGDSGKIGEFEESKNSWILG
jgi:hypothetical protein